MTSTTSITSYYYCITNKEIIDEITTTMNTIKNQNLKTGLNNVCEEFTFPCSLEQIDKIAKLLENEFEFEFEQLNKWIIQGYVSFKK